MYTLITTCKLDLSRVKQSVNADGGGRDFNVIPMYIYFFFIQGNFFLLQCRDHKYLITPLLNGLVLFVIKFLDVTVVDITDRAVNFVITNVI